MKLKIAWIAFVGCLINSLDNNAANTLSPDSMYVAGNETYLSNFFKKKYLHNTFAHFLDNYADVVTYQIETTGDFQIPDLSIFSISGNSYRWNRYYINGFRVDNRLFSGSNLYTPSLYSNAITIDAYNSSLYFNTDTVVANNIAIRYNIGGIGGISPLAENLVNLYHPTALQRLYKPINNRRKMNSAGNISLNFSIPAKKGELIQQFDANWGSRMLVGFDFSGINSYYPEDFVKLELKGDLPIISNSIFDKVGYLSSYLYRTNLYTELNFSSDESLVQKAFSFSFYGSKKRLDESFTTGLTYSFNSLNNNSLNFSRNLIDQDGEAFEPWVPGAGLYEISHAFNYSKKLGKHLMLKVETYNSVINFSPYTNSFKTTSYAENVNLPFHSLYLYEWESNAFISGLLENKVQLFYQKRLTNWLNLNTEVSTVFDGMLIKEKTRANLNWEGLLNFEFNANDFISAEINLGRRRVPYNFEQIKFLSNDYLNGTLFYWNDFDANKTFEENEKQDFFATTGGKFHSISPEIKQQNYIIVDLPIHLSYNKHKLSFYNTYKKFNNLWTTHFKKPESEYGFFTQIGEQEIFFFNPGVKEFLIGYNDGKIMHSDKSYNWLIDSPWFMSSTVKYQYQSQKFLFSFAWTSYLMAGPSSLGNGPLHNNIDVYSETTANPNNSYKLIGRLDQDRALVARILASYNVTKNWVVAFSGKFKDGQPFTNFNTHIYSTKTGNTQLAIWNNRTKGINPFGGDFGSRDDAFFNLELRTSYLFEINKNTFDLGLTVYNFYDFGTELVEYSFQPDNSTTRYAMELNIPRGIIMTLKMFVKN